MRPELYINSKLVSTANQHEREYRHQQLGTISRQREWNEVNREQRREEIWLESNQQQQQQQQQEQPFLPSSILLPPIALSSQAAEEIVGVFKV